MVAVGCVSSELMWGSLSSRKRFSFFGQEMTPFGSHLNDKFSLSVFCLCGSSCSGIQPHLLHLSLTAVWKNSSGWRIPQASPPALVSLSRDPAAFNETAAALSCIWATMEMWHKIKPQTPSL